MNDNLQMPWKEMRKSLNDGINNLICRNDSAIAISEIVLDLRAELSRVFGSLIRQITTFQAGKHAR